MFFEDQMNAGFLSKAIVAWAYGQIKINMILSVPWWVEGIPWDHMYKGLNDLMGSSRYGSLTVAGMNCLAI